MSGPHISPEAAKLSRAACFLAAALLVAPCHMASASDANAQTQGDNIQNGEIRDGDIQDEEIEEIVITTDLGSMPGQDMRSIFGFAKSIFETPRSASTISEEMMSRFIIGDIDELIALAPGSFTQSFFGVAGTLDIRGTPGETYFRGMRRLDNPGNYPTPLAASSHVEVVRGPASPIHGPSRIGGYINFEPRAPRSDGAATGSARLELGSWEQRIAAIEAGGSGQIASRELGYHLYAEAENSDGYYRDLTTDQAIFQAGFTMRVNAVELQFGGMYQDYDSMENGGWNRITQALIDDGVYVTGSPLPLDANGDGYISHQEFDVDGDGFTDLSPFAAGLAPGTLDPLNPQGPFPGSCRIGPTLVFGCQPQLWVLQNPGLGRLDGDQVLIDPDDVHSSKVTTLYFDVIADRESGWGWRNQMFFEAYDFLAEVAYGFSQFHDTWVFEDKLILANRYEWDDGGASVQISPSVRLTNFRHADDWSNEYFDRRDLTQATSSLDRRLLSTRIDDDYTDYFIGDYLDWGLAAMADIDWGSFNVVAGARYDLVDLKSRQPLEKLLLPSARNFCLDASCVVPQAEDQVEGFSWTLSLSYAISAGLRAYLTASQQATVITGQGADLTTYNVASGGAFDESRLLEFGLKGSLLDDVLYFALAVYEQERIDFSSQQIVTNQASRTEGVEFELRWLISDRLLASFGYSDIEVVNLNTLDRGGRFSFIGAEDVPGIEPSALYGAALAGVLVPETLDARRAGIPERVWSLAATYDFGAGFAASASVVDVDSTYSGFTKAVALPAYTLVNTGVVFERGNWLISAAAKNLTNERYFRANFPNLFGGVVVLPELPRHYAVRVQYQW